MTDTVLVSILCLLMCGVALVSDAEGTHGSKRVPVCMIIDDPGPFLNAGTTGYPGVVHETQTSFYKKLGQWARANGVKGKFSVVPICGGIAAIDGSLGEYPNHTESERLAWIDMIKTLYQPNWTITPEIITHLLPWDIVRSVTIDNDGQRENEYFAALSVEQKTDYVAYALQKLKNVGITAGGCTMCWSIPTEQNADFGRAVLDAMARVYGPRNVMIFNDSYAEPAVVYRSPSGHAAVKVPSSVGDLDGVLYRSGAPTPARVHADAEALISADGQSGKFVDQIRRGEPLIFLTHIQVLYTNGLESGFNVYKTAIDRLNKFYGDRIEWVKAEELVERYASR